MADRGRPSRYTVKVAQRICKRLSEGESLRAICRGKGYPAESTVRAWALDDLHGFSAQYARARDLGLDAMADELLEICDDGSNDWMERTNDEGEAIGWVLNGEHVQRSRLRADTRKWLLSKMAAKKYGDRIEQHHTGGISVTKITEQFVMPDGTEDTDAPDLPTTH